MSEKEIIFMLGLPGSGKTDWIDKNNINGRYAVVSADDIRVKHPKYNPERPEDIHEECVEQAKRDVIILANLSYNIIMDGGGINNSYTMSIIDEVKKLGYYVKIVFINTPVGICIQRNNERVKNNLRFVPTEAIIDKSYRLKKQIDRLKSVCDEFISVDYFTNKYIFVDLDGTVTEYQQLPVDEFGDINFVAYEVFRNAKPVEPVISRLKKLSDSGKRIFIVSASPNSICNKEKIDWIKENMPFVKENDIYFVGKKEFKYVFLHQLIDYLRISANECMAIDDDHQVLATYKRLNINCVHPSLFMANY